MNALILSTLSTSCALFVGCCSPTVEYVTVTKEVKVPVATPLPKIYCDLNQSIDTDVIYEAARCIEDFVVRDGVFSGGMQ